jgi:hypothetical protein
LKGSLNFVLNPIIKPTGSITNLDNRGALTQEELLTTTLTDEDVFAAEDPISKGSLNNLTKNNRSQNFIKIDSEQPIFITEKEAKAIIEALRRLRA